MKPSLSKLRIKIFADGADRAGILRLAKQPHIQGFTTNPTLMHRAGVTDYEHFARDLLTAVPDRPFALEVFSDDFPEMERQAIRIASFGPTVYVKIPVTNARADSSQALVRRLVDRGIQLNVTALMTLDQVREVSSWLAGGPPCFISVLAGRVADTGRDPVPLMKTAVELLRPHSHIELMWASPRELLNVIQADDIGCHVITVSHDLLAKLPLLGKDLNELSLETVRMFYRDAKAAGFVL